MVFQDNYDGTFWMTLEERGYKRHRQLDEPTNVANKKAKLLRNLQKADFSMASLKGKRVCDLKDLATLNSVVTVKPVQRERARGWMGKPKGLLQILWEREFIYPNVGTRIYYTIGGRNNQYGNTMLDTSFCNLMRNCIKFI